MSRPIPAVFALALMLGCGCSDETVDVAAAPPALAIGVAEVVAALPPDDRGQARPPAVAEGLEVRGGRGRIRSAGWHGFLLEARTRPLLGQAQQV